MRPTPCCHIERIETSPDVIRQAGPKPEILRFAQDDNCELPLHRFPLKSLPRIRPIPLVGLSVCMTCANLTNPIAVEN